MKHTEKSLRIEFSSKTDIDFNLKVGNCFLVLKPPVSYEYVDMRIGKMLKISNRKYTSNQSQILKRIGKDIVFTINYIYIPVKYIGSVREVI